MRTIKLFSLLLMGAMSVLLFSACDNKVLLPLILIGPIHF